MIVMGADMDWPALQEAARAHVGAIERKDAKGVLTQRDLQSILAGLGKAISSVPASTVMGVYDEMGKLAGESSGIPANLFQKQNLAHAVQGHRQGLPARCHRCGGREAVERFLSFHQGGPMELGRVLADTWHSRPHWVGGGYRQDHRQGRVHGRRARQGWV